MSFRYRKSTKIGPFRLTAGKNGLSVSAGVKGARVSLASDGKVRRTVSLPGTGLSDTKVIGGIGHVPAQGAQPDEDNLFRVARLEDGSFFVNIDPKKRPTFAQLMELQNAGLTGLDVKLINAQWWEQHDANTPPSRNPLSSNGSWNRRIRARRLAKLRAKQATP
jgi:hypothetical protein